jgi:peptide/nickel transport system permease protein
MKAAIHSGPAPGRLRLALAFAGRQTLAAFNTNKTSWIGLSIMAAVILAAVFAPLLAPHDPLAQDVFARLVEPSERFPLGSDYYGRDILSRLLYGARVSLVIGALAIAGAVAVGSTIGILAGYYGGRFDILAMQAMDILLAFPSLILGLIVVAMLGPSLTNLVIAIGLTAVPPFARIARAPTIAVKEREFVEAGRALGFSDARLMGLHILPNVFPEILVMASIWLATAIRVEASLAFIGLGVKPPTPTWGGMIREGFENILDGPWLAVWPGLAILVVVFSLNLLGDGLRDAIDPKLRGET